MLVLLSPAKTLDYESPIAQYPLREPEFSDQSALLINELKELNAQEISQLMKVSEKIGILNQERFEDWDRTFTDQNSRPALFAFKGDVYTGLEAESLSTAQVKWADKHLRHLSGLYGLLKPLDFMQPYRLEMGTRFQNQRGKNLYEFWGSQITETLNQQLGKSKALVQLASNEYSQVVQLKEIKVPVITPVFKDTKNGKLKIISFYAKKARGYMARYIIENKITQPQDLKNFDTAGYSFDASLSNDTEWVFTRGEQA